MGIYTKLQQRQCFTPPSVSMGPDIRDKIETGLDNAVRIDINNVAELLYHSEKAVYDREADFPNVAPPFSTLWMEYTIPRELSIASAHPVYLEFDPPSIGILMVSDRQESGWTVEALLFAVSRDPRSETYSAGIPAFIGADIFHVTTEGKTSESQALSAIPTELIHPEYGGRLDGFSISTFVHPALLAISFMHCKNVIMTDAPDTRTRQQRRHDERKGREPVQFKTLLIEPMKQVLKTEGRIERNGLKKALHICRGHFANYSDDKPLFGKYTGTFWRPAHVRGSADIGMVGKDYKVKAPKEATS